MVDRPGFSQTQIEMVTLDQLVPKDHLLRKIDAAVDFSFTHDRVAQLYCPDNGRPPLDPTRMFKALFIGYLFGVRSERQFVREIEVNVAYRWFLRMGLTEAVFDASTLSQNRRRPTEREVWSRRTGGRPRRRLRHRRHRQRFGRARDRQRCRLSDADAAQARHDAQKRVQI